MLTLSAIYLHNWHRFTHTLLEVRDSLYLAGHNGSGKSSILDALQMLLVANLGAIRFNASAQDRSERTLESYVRGKVGEGGWLRPHNTVAYLAVQFTNTDNGAPITLGVCIEASEGHDTERIYFVLAEPLDPRVFFAKDTPLTRRELRQFCRQRAGAQAFDQIEEYQDVMLNSLGGLNPRFVGLFVRALRFQPVGSINAFVETWLLPEEQLDLATFQHVVQRLGDLEHHARDVREKVEALNAIVDRQGEIARLGDRRAEYLVLAALLRRMLADQRVTALVTQQTDQDAALQDTERESAKVRTELAGDKDALLEAQVALKQSAVIRQRDALRAQGQALRSTCEAMEGRWRTLLNELQRERRQLEPLLDDAAIEPEAQRSLAAFLEQIDLQRPDDPPSPSLAQLLTVTEPLLLEERERTLQEFYQLQGQERALVEDTHRLQQEIADLEARGVSFPPSVERVRTILAARIGTVPPLVCECLEINDERWQNAVEALLGDHRFVIVVPPAYVADAVQLLEDLRSRGEIDDVGVLDSERADEQACLVHPQSLTRYVEIKHPLLVAYLHGLLGAVIACDTVDELRQHAGAVTVDVMVGADQVIRALPRDRYDLWYIGERAQRAQIELRQRHLTEVHARRAALQPHLKRIDRYRQP